MISVCNVTTVLHIMDCKILALILSLSHICAGQTPQSSQNVDATYYPDGNIETFQSLSQHASMQPNQLKYRYAQQQKIDFNNPAIFDKMHSDYYEAQPSNPRKRTQGRRSRKLFTNIQEKANIELLKLQPEQHADKESEDVTKNTRIIRKALKIKLVDSKEVLTDRQDLVSPNYEQIIYVEPDILKRAFGLSVSEANQILKNSAPDEQDLTALSSLLDKTPNAQLAGLQQLLQYSDENSKAETSNESQLLSLQQVSNENVVNHEKQNAGQSSHNLQQQVALTGVSYSKESLADIQAQLNAASQSQAQRAIAEAQYAAQAQLDAHHRRIASIQEQARKEALAKISAHNNDFGHAEALPLVSQEGSSHSHHQALASQNLDHVVQAQVHPQNEAILQAQAYKQLAIQQEAVLREAAEIEHQANLKKISVTQAHSLQQTHQSPESYQEVVLKNEQVDNVYPSAIAQVHSEVDDHQYAARYAFGYRIKDYKEGNDFGHEERREGKRTKGHYHVLLPDGRLQKVDYYADPTGYHAKVTYENVAHH